MVPPDHKIGHYEKIPTKIKLENNIRLIKQQQARVLLKVFNCSRVDYNDYSNEHTLYMYVIIENCRSDLARTMSMT